MAQIDKTRDNLKVEALNNHERKELFNKLVKAGGQVIREKPKTTIRIDREKQRELQRRLDENRKNLRSTESTVSFSRNGSSPQPSSSEVNYVGGLSLLSVRFKLFFMGVTNFGGTHFKKKFLERFKVEYNPALMELQMLYLDLFKQNPHQGWKIIEQLDKLRPLYFELIEMASDVYDISIPAKILDSYTALPNEHYRVLDYRAMFLEYFRRIYIIHRYVDTIDFAFEKAVSLQQSIERGKSSLYSTKRKKAGNAIFVIFNKFFPRLHLITSIIKGEKLDLYNTKKLDDMFGIKPEMKPGSRIPNQPSSLFSTELAPEPVAEVIEEPAPDQPEELLPMPEEVKRGLGLMDMADIPRLRAELIKDDILRRVSENDKVLMAYLLFSEFDREYSFIFTTYKMKFTPAYSIRGKSDYREKLTDLYNLMRPCFDSLKEYFIGLDIYERARADRPTSHDQYFPYTKRLTELDREKKAKGRAAKAMLQMYMEKIIEETGILLDDMDHKHEIVQNPQDLLEFDAPVDLSLKLKDRKIHEAMRAAHYYASAMYFRLAPGGDMYGEQTPDMDSKPAVIVDQKPAEQKTPEQPKPVQEKLSDGETPKKSDSILGELDDLV